MIGSSGPISCRRCRRSIIAVSPADRSIRETSVLTAGSRPVSVATPCETPCCCSSMSGAWATGACSAPCATCCCARAFYGLIVLLLLTGPLYFFFRKSPAIPDLRFSELLVAMVYTYSLIKIFDIVFKFFTIHGDVGDLTFLLPIIPLKQMSGFPWWKTILFVVLSYIILLLMCFILMCIAVAIELLRKGVI